jgi:S1-C subfamily serine protease
VDRAGGSCRPPRTAGAPRNGGGPWLRPGKVREPAWSARIKKLDDQNYEVDRDLVHELVSGATRPGGVRWVPTLDHGEVTGVKLYNVSPDSIPWALGLHSGDALTAIDGAPLKSADQLLDLYARLGQLSAVELSGTHAGKPIVRTLRLR